MTSVPRSEVMETSNHPALSKLCHQTKNLYNRANYLYKQNQRQGTFLTYYKLDSILKQDACYRELPAHTAQHTLKLLIRN
ncbi:MAG: hypothetical protein ACTSYH_11545 [Candidatus Heimdallarchaeaceae archaeon]